LVIEISLYYDARSEKRQKNWGTNIYPMTFVCFLQTDLPECAMCLIDWHYCTTESGVTLPELTLAYTFR